MTGSGVKLTTIKIVSVVKMNLPLVHRSLDEVLKVFQDEQYKDYKPVKDLLEIYNKQLSLYKKIQTENTSKKFMLVILEGLDGSGKTTICKILSEKLGGVRWCTPPHELWDLRPQFDSTPSLKTAFYALGNYIAAMQVSAILRKRHVLMDRYWHSTAAFALGRAIKEDPVKYQAPPKGHEFYSWPSDLLKPSKVFLLHVSEAERLKRLSRRKGATLEEKQLKEDEEFRRNVVAAYKNMVDPTIQVIDADGTKEENVAEILKRLV